MDLEMNMQRFEQQLNAFEKLHADELKDFREKLAIYMRLHADEVKLLREELAEVKKVLDARLAAPVIAHSSVLVEHGSNDEVVGHSLDRPSEEASI